MDEEALQLLRSIDRKLDRLLIALADEQDDDPRRTLDGEPMPADRVGGESLG